MARWRCVVLAISCALVGSCLSAPSSHQPAPVVLLPEFDSVNGGINSGAQNSYQSAFEEVITHLRNKRQGPAKQCEAVGGYCRYHEDCCSQLCLSFSYKCVNRPAQSPFNPVIPNGQNAGAQAGAEEVANRFGETNSSIAPAKKCAELGGYCQRSTDCCSGTCLSFSYKCISNSNTPFFRPPSSSQNGFVFEVGQQFPSPENAITIEELVNRFGSGNEDKDNSVLPAGSANTSPPQGTGSISGSTPTTSLIPPRPINASNTNTNPGCISSGAQCRFSNQCCSNLCVQLTATNQFCADQVQQQSQSGVTSPPGSTTVTQQQQCLVIGSKCYAHAECCSTRCHMFLHQCVT